MAANRYDVTVTLRGVDGNYLASTKSFKPMTIELATKYFVDEKYRIKATNKSDYRPEIKTIVVRLCESYGGRTRTITKYVKRVRVFAKNVRKKEEKAEAKRQKKIAKEEAKKQKKLAKIDEKYNVEE